MCSPSRSQLCLEALVMESKANMTNFFPPLSNVCHNRAGPIEQIIRNNIWYWRILGKVPKTNESLSPYKNKSTLESLYARLMSVSFSQEIIKKHFNITIKNYKTHTQKKQSRMFFLPCVVQSRRSIQTLFWTSLPLVILTYLYTFWWESMRCRPTIKKKVGV